MASETTNRASLTYQYGENTGSALSNAAKPALAPPLAVEKTSLAAEYRRDSAITFILTVANNGRSLLSDLEVEDDLAAYVLPGPLSVLPLDYVGPARLYINGAFVSELKAEETEEGSVFFTIPSLGAGENAMILYQARVNAYAPLDTGAVLTNDSSFMTEDMEEALYASYTLRSEDYADVRVLKSLSPHPAIPGGPLTISYFLYNYGNREATGVILRDALEQPMTGLSLKVNGDTVDPLEYEETEGALTIPREGASLSLTVPAAAFLQGEGGLVHIDPGVTVVTVSGRI